MAYICHFQSIVFLLPFFSPPFPPPSFSFHSLEFTRIMLFHFYARISFFPVTPLVYGTFSSFLLLRMVSLFPLLRLPHEVISRDMFPPPCRVSLSLSFSYFRLCLFCLAIPAPLSLSPPRRFLASSLISHSLSALLTSPSFLSRSVYLLSRVFSSTVFRICSFFLPSSSSDSALCPVSSLIVVFLAPGHPLRLPPSPSLTT